MGRSLARFVVLAALAVLGAPVTAVTAGAAVLGCGQVVTQDTVLENDVGPCPANGAHGIVVEASNVVLDLNGHTVFARPRPGGRGRASTCSTARCSPPSPASPAALPSPGGAWYDTS